MKKYKSFKSLLGFVMVAVVMFSFSLAKANDDNKPNANADRPEFNKDLQDKKGVFQDDTKEKRDAFKAETDAEQKAFLDDLKAKRTTFMSELNAKKEEWKNAKADKKAEFCEKAGEIVNMRFNVAISKLTEVETKVADIIAGLKTDGKDTALATTALDLSKSKLADAKAKLAEVKGLVPADCSTLTAEVFGNIKLGARVAKDLLKESRQDLHQSIQEIKILKDENKDNDQKDENEGADNDSDNN